MTALSTAPAAPTLTELDFPDSSDSTTRNYRHMDRCRRVRVGPAVTLIFEDGHTLWFRMQELAGVARQSPPDRLRKQLDWYARLLPTSHRLLAAIWLTVPGCRFPTHNGELREALAAGQFRLNSSSGHRIEASLRPERVNHRLIGLVGWVEFRFTPEDRRAFRCDSLNWKLEIQASEYHHESDWLPSSVIHSLAADLQAYAA